jgi:hypothetical protein
MYCLFCVVLRIVCVYMCTVLLPPGGYPIAVKYIIYHITYRYWDYVFLNVWNVQVAFPLNCHVVSVSWTPLYLCSQICVKVSYTAFEMWWHTRRNRISSFGETETFKLAGASVQSTTGSRGVRISGSNAGYTMFLGSVKGTGYPLHSPVSLSLPLPCVTFQLDST